MDDVADATTTTTSAMMMMMEDQEAEEEEDEAVGDSDDLVVVASFRLMESSSDAFSHGDVESFRPEIADADANLDSAPRCLSSVHHEPAPHCLSSIHRQLTVSPNILAAGNHRTNAGANVGNGSLQQQTLLPSYHHRDQTYIPYSLGDESRGNTSTYILGSPRRALFDRVFFDDDRVLHNLLANEERYMPKPLYFKNLQSDLQPFMRKMVVDWMLEVCDEQRCDDDVFALAVNYLDRFLSMSGTPVAKNQLQLLAAVSMFIASKLKESLPGLSGEKLVIYTDKSITLKQLFDWELLMLSTLKWDMAAITPLDFLDQLLWRMSFPLNVNVTRVREVALCVILLSFTDYKFSHYPPSMIAATCITFAVTYLRDSDESRLHLPHPADLALSPSHFQQDEKFRDAPFPYHIQWCFADSRFPSILAEESLIVQLQNITAIDAECLRQCYEHIAQLVHSSCGQATLSTIKGGIAGFSPAPSPAATPTDVVEVSKLIENPVA